MLVEIGQALWFIPQDFHEIILYLRFSYLSTQLTAAQQVAGAPGTGPFAYFLNGFLTPRLL